MVQVRFDYNKLAGDCNRGFKSTNAPSNKATQACQLLLNMLGLNITQSIWGNVTILDGHPLLHQRLVVGYTHSKTHLNLLSREDGMHNCFFKAA